MEHVQHMNTFMTMQIPSSLASLLPHAWGRACVTFALASELRCLGVPRNSHGVTVHTLQLEACCAGGIDGNLDCDSRESDCRAQ